MFKDIPNGEGALWTARDHAWSMWCRSSYSRPAPLGYAEVSSKFEGSQTHQLIAIGTFELYNKKAKIKTWTQTCVSLHSPWKYTHKKPPNLWKPVIPASPNFFGGNMFLMSLNGLLTSTQKRSRLGGEPNLLSALLFFFPQEITIDICSTLIKCTNIRNGMFFLFGFTPVCPVRNPPPMTRTLGISGEGWVLHDFQIL